MHPACSISWFATVIRSRSAIRCACTRETPGSSSRNSSPPLRHRAASAQIPLHQGRQGDDDGVPDVVAEAVVDGLEVIDIEGDDRQRPGLRLIVVQHLLHGPPVEEARHGVCVAVGVQLVNLGVEQPSPLRMACLSWAASKYQARMLEMLEAASC